MTRRPRPAHIPILEVPFGQNVSPEPTPRRNDPAGEAVEAVLSGEWRYTPEAAEAHDANRLLAALAAALNAVEAAGYPVRLAHGAVLTPVGYVLPVFPEAGERFAVRTMALTEFPVAPDDDD